MNYDFLKCCDKLLKVLPSEVIMEPSVVAEYLNVTESYAMTVIERLRKDGHADGFGTGPVSRNKRTAVFPDFYKEEIEKTEGLSSHTTLCQMGIRDCRYKYSITNSAICNKIDMGPNIIVAITYRLVTL